MSERDAAALAADATAGRGPWRDAWRRLRKNRMAMFGGGVVAIMGVISLFAEFIAPFDASYQEMWIGARPPGFTHPEVTNVVDLAVGQPARVAESARSGPGRKTLSLRVERREPDILVLKGSGKRLTEIRRERGAVRLPEFALSEPEDELETEEGEPLPVDLRLESGKDLPDALAHRVTDGRWVLRLAEYRRITTVAFDVEAVLEGDRVLELRRDGQPVDRLEVPGRSVRRILRDGRPLEHRHLLGTDASGRDTLSRTIYGGRISLLIGLLATVVTVLIGVVYGAVAGYVGGRTDAILMRVVDILFALPYMFLVILLLVFFGRDLVNLFIALGAVQWLTMARIVRGQVLSLKEKEFVEAARMAGTGHLGILFRHLIPNTLGVVVVYTTLTVPAVILQESFLAFIGLAVEYKWENLASWGALVDYGRLAMSADLTGWWLLATPSFAMALTLFSLNFLGDGLRDALDPQMRGRE
jgi:oligopeptide transport system permease protein